MSNRERKRAIAISLAVLGLSTASCDSKTAVPQTTDARVVDARPIDAREADAPGLDATVCPCPGTELLSRKHLIDRWSTFGEWTPGISLSCEVETDLLFNGTCAYENTSTLSDLQIADIRRPEGYDWRCWRRTSSGVAFQISSRCLRPFGPPTDLPEGCTCPAVETPVDRIFFKEQMGTVQPNGLAEVSTSCPAGTTLLAGGCTGLRDPFGDATLIGAGMDPDEPGTWRCNWHNTSTNALGGAAAVVCMNPPGPDAVTGAAVAPEVTEFVFAEQNLPARSSRILDVTCAPGDVLIAGGCHVEDVQESIKTLRLLRTGMFEPEANRPDTWQCAWRNPTDATPNAVAMAVCLKPGAAAPSP